MAPQLTATNGPSAARALGVYTARDQLLARAAFAGDEHRTVRVRNAIDDGEHVHQRHRRADDAAHAGGTTLRAALSPAPPGSARDQHSAEPDRSGDASEAPCKRAACEAWDNGRSFSGASLPKQARRLGLTDRQLQVADQMHMQPP